MDEDSIPEEGDKHNETEIRNNKLSTLRVLPTSRIRSSILGGTGMDRFIRSYYFPVLLVSSSVFWLVYLLA
jgi:hypothetical protein